MNGAPGGGSGEVGSEGAGGEGLKRIKIAFDMPSYRYDLVDERIGDYA
jgi:hypothetical protein